MPRPAVMNFQLGRRVGDRVYFFVQEWDNAYGYGVVTSVYVASGISGYYNVKIEWCSGNYEGVLAGETVIINIRETMQRNEYESAYGEIGDGMTTEQENRYVCGHCATSFVAVYDVIQSDLTDDVYCSWGCYDEVHAYCCECDRAILVEEYDDNGGYCLSCAGANSHMIHEYHSQNKAFQKFGNDPLGRYIGIEWENDGGRDRGTCAKDISEFFPDYAIYFERDGSLSSNGFESITAPMTFDYIMENENRFADMAGILRSYGFLDNAYDAGVHIHFSRCWLGEWETLRDYNLMKLMTIVEMFWSEICKFAGRNTSWARNHGTSDPKTLDTIIKNKYPIEKYQAVNICPTSTFEFRMFASSTDHNVIMAYVEFCRALVECAVDSDINDICNATRFSDICVFSDRVLELAAERGAEF